MDKRDPYNHEAKWFNWKERIERSKGKIVGVSKHNSELIVSFLFDMELGKNVAPSSKKGERSFIRLNTLKDKMMFFSRHFKKDFDKITSDQIHKFFNDMRMGKIVKEDGSKYRGVGNFVKDFKAFWNWMRRTGRVNNDIVEYLSRKESKPSWVYLTEEEFKHFANRLIFDYKALAFFLYDTGMRVTEAYSIKVKDFNEDFTKLAISPEISKTIGRTISLKLCSSLMKEFVKHHELGPNDYIFIKSTTTFNKYLKENCQRIFGDGETLARGKYSQFTAYDIRHNSACFWLKRYNKTQGLMYRFGWTQEKEINYYSEFLGMKDEILDDDMIVAEDKNKLIKLEEHVKKQDKKIDILLKHFSSYQDLLNEYAETGKISIRIDKQSAQESKKIKEELMQHFS